MINYYVCLISITILGMVYFGIMSFISLLHFTMYIIDTARIGTSRISNPKNVVFKIFMFALCVALYNYLIITQM